MPTAEYVTDVPYVRAFTSDLSPVLLRLVAALNGLPAASPTHFDYCELGSGHGDTLATLAAAHPNARFLGVDINAEHVAFARDFASRGGLANAAYLERDFEALLGDEVGPFVFIAAHGVLTWVSPAKRRALVEVASAKLRPGGLLYVGYNALPGWAAVEPLRRLLIERGAAVGGSTLERARAGVSLAKRLSEAGAAYFAANPSVKEMLATMEKV
ncbi:MAG TPA: class I SAM-dependent methyltransferase, partial [Polyangiaceae bacterium]